MASKSSAAPTSATSPGPSRNARTRRPLTNPAAAGPSSPAAELALTGQVVPDWSARISSPWTRNGDGPGSHHNRTEAWYTRERCQDLIDSIAKDEQQEPALARKLNGRAGF